MGKLCIAMLRVAVLAGLVSIGAFGALRLGDGPGANAATQFTAFAGGGEAGIAVETFRPKALFVHAGDTIEWLNPYAEPHTVTFLAPGMERPELIVPLGAPPPNAPPTLIFNPEVAFPTMATTYDGSAYANSGILEEGNTFALTFTEVGRYPFICVFHPNMTGAVQVVRDDVQIPTQEQIDTDAAAQLADGLAEGQAAVASVQPGSSANDDGTMTWEVVTPPSTEDVDLLRFEPQRLSIAAGDSVTWQNDTLVPHTVTFTSGEVAPELVLPEPQEAGPPNLVINPDALFPNGRSSYDGTGFVNSGFYGAGPEAVAGDSFSLTFTEPGTYLYICILHANAGMSGVIEVSAASITPPSTGDGGLRSEWSTGVAGLGLVGLAFGIAGGWLVRRRMVGGREHRA